MAANVVDLHLSLTFPDSGTAAGFRSDVLAAFAQAYPQHVDAQNPTTVLQSAALAYVFEVYRAYKHSVATTQAQTQAEAQVASVLNAATGVLTIA